MPVLVVKGVNSQRGGESDSWNLRDRVRMWNEGKVLVKEGESKNKSDKVSQRNVRN